MKNIINLLLLLVVSAFVFSCGGGANTPEKVADSFLNAVNNKDFEKAKELSTPESHQMIDLISSFAKNVEETEEVEKVIKIGKCTVEGETATCDYCCDSEGKETSIKLKMIDGNWKADLSKEALFGDENPFENVDLNGAAEGEEGVEEEVLETEETATEEVETESAE